MNLGRLYCWKPESEESVIRKESQAAERAWEERGKEWWRAEEEHGYLKENVCRLLCEAEAAKECIFQPISMFLGVSTLRAKRRQRTRENRASCTIE